MSRRKRQRGIPVAAEEMERRLLFTTNAWKSAVSGDWDTAGNWSLGHVPTSSEDVSIIVAGSYTVTHSTGNDSCASITSDEPLVLSGGNLTVSGDVKVNNTFTLSGGTLNSATIEPGSGGQGIIASGGGATLAGVTLAANVSIPGGTDMTFNGVTLSSDTVTIASNTAGQTADLILDNGSTLGGTGDVHFAGSAPASDEIFAVNLVPVTFGPNITIDGSGGSLNINFEAPAFVNQGTIDSDISGQTITINGGITNDGLIEAKSGGNVNIAASWTNDMGATMSVQGGGTLTLGTNNFTNPSSNAGTISETNSTLDLGNDFTNTGSITRSGGTVNLTGLYNLNGGSRTLTTADGAYVLDGGGFENGTISFTGSGAIVPSSTGGQFINATLGTSLTMVNGNGITTNNLTLGSGVVLTLSSTGTLTVLTMASGSFVDGPGTIDFAGSSPAEDEIFAVNAAAVTFGASLTIHGSGGTFAINYGAPAFINHGTIDCDVSGQTMSSDGSIDNFGTLEVQNGGGFNLGAQWTNESGGIVSATGGGTLQLGPAGSSSVGSNAGTLTENNSTLNLGELFTSTGSITRTAGTVNIIGLYNLSSGTLALNSTTGPYVLDGGGVENGTITFADGDRLVPTSAGGELANDTLDNNIHITNGTTLSIGHGMTLNADVILRGATATTTLDFDQNNYAAQTIGGNGAVIFAGSNTSFDQIISLNDQGPVTIGSGITIEGNQGRLYLNFEKAAYINDGIIEDDVAGGSLSLPANALTNNGVIEAAPGTISLDGSGFTESGTFTVGIGSTVAGTSYGQIISTTGTLTLGGTLNTPLLPGFTPTAGQNFTPIKYVAATGSFSKINTNVGDGDGFNFATGATSATLTATTGGNDFADISAPSLLTVNGTINDDTINLSKSFDVDSAVMNGTTNVFFSNRITNILVNGNAGNDSITSGISNDTLIGNAGNDTLVGAGGGNNTLQGAGGNDSIEGRGSNNSLRGGGNDDSLVGGSGNDIVVGGAGNDTIVGGSGEETLAGGPGNDCLVGGSGAESLIGGAGTDTLDAAGHSSDTLDASLGTGDSILDTVPGDSVIL